MVHFGAQLALAASLAAYAVASPVEKRAVIAVEKRATSSQYLAKDLVARDQSRIAHYNERAAINRGEKVVSKRASSGTVTNKDVRYVQAAECALDPSPNGLLDSYIAKVQICSTTYSLIVDTGSSNTWVRTLALASDMQMSVQRVFSSGWCRPPLEAFVMWRRQRWQYQRQLRFW